MAKEDIVVQGNALISVDRHDWTLQEQKLFLFLVSRIDSIKDKDLRTMTITVKEFADMIGINNKGSIYQELGKVTERLLGRVFCIGLGNETTQFQVLSRAKYKHKEGMVEITIHEDMKPYLLEISKNFTAYELKSISKVASIYALRIYGLVRMYERLGGVTYALSDLRSKLGIKPCELVNFAHFNNRVLEISRREINSKTDLQFDYEPIKEGRKVVQIRFRVKRLKRKRESVIDLLPNTLLGAQGEEPVNVIKNLRPTTLAKSTTTTANNSKPKRSTARPTSIIGSASTTTATSGTVSTDALILKANIFQRVRYYLRSLFSK